MINGEGLPGALSSVVNATLLKHLAVVLLLGLAPSLVSAAEFRYRPESNLKFHGVSTIRSWTCDTVPVEGSLGLPFRVESRRDLLEKLEGFEPVGVLKIPVDSIDCGESGFFDHNQNLYNTLEGDEYPYVTFDPVLIRDVSYKKGVRATIVGDLKLTDTTRRETVPLSIDVAGTDTLRVTGEFTVSLEKYGLEPPQLMFGLISIYDRVRITIDLRLIIDTQRVTPKAPGETIPVRK